VSDLRSINLETFIIPSHIHKLHHYHRYRFHLRTCEVPDSNLDRDAIDGESIPLFHPNEKANVTKNYLENQFTSQHLCDKNHERRVETTVQALLASVDDIPWGN
jgi:hypothetical protein